MEHLNGNDMILWFDDLGSGNEEHNFLSNFYEGEPLFGLYKTGEHAFAAMKFLGSDDEHYIRILNAPDPNTAKALGRSREHPIRKDWEIVKLDVMAAVVREKFSPNRDEGRRLLLTGDRLLVEGTYWDDRVWGVDLEEGTLPGRNWLGTLLMARRAELRAEILFNTPRVRHIVNDTKAHNFAFGKGENG